MEIVIEKNRIIFIGLLYNYIANTKTSLSEKYIKDFIENVVVNLQRDENKCELVSAENDEFEFWKYGIIYHKQKKEYILEPSNYMNTLYKIQPDELIKATLQENALSSIWVDKKNLQIETYYRIKHGVTDIYSLESERAKKSTREILENEGCIDIEIGYATPGQLSTDKGYHVHYKCKEPFERVKVLAKSSNSEN